MLVVIDALVAGEGDADVMATHNVPHLAIILVVMGAALVATPELARMAPRGTRTVAIIPLLLLVRLGMRPIVVSWQALFQSEGEAFDPREAWNRALEAPAVFREYSYPGYAYVWVGFLTLAVMAALRLHRASWRAQAPAFALLTTLHVPLFHALSDPGERPGFERMALAFSLGALPAVLGALALAERWLARRPATIGVPSDPENPAEGVGSPTGEISARRENA